jgi:hypothetical protein
MAAGQILIFSGPSMSFSGEAIDIFEGGDVDLAGARWTAKVRSDDSLSLTVAVTSDDRSQVRNSLRKDINHEVTERNADVGAITRQIETYIRQIEEVHFFLRECRVSVQSFFVRVSRSVFVVCPKMN